MTFRLQTCMYKLRIAPRHGCFRTLTVRSAFTISVYHFCGNLGRKKQNRFIQSIFGREDRIGMFGVYSAEKTGSGCSEYIREKRQDRGIFRTPAEAQNLYRSISKAFCAHSSEPSPALKRECGAASAGILGFPALSVFRSHYLHNLHYLQCLQRSPHCSGTPFLSASFRAASR